MSSINERNIALDRIVHEIVSSDNLSLVIWDIQKNVWWDILDIVSMLELLESSKVISFLWEKNENWEILLTWSYHSKPRIIQKNLSDLNKNTLKNMIFLSVYINQQVYGSMKLFLYGKDGWNCTIAYCFRRAVTLLVKLHPYKS